jgi:hypothetical protein
VDVAAYRDGRADRLDVGFWTGESAHGTPPRADTQWGLLEVCYVTSHRLALTLHKALFDNFAESLHLGLWQVLALLGLLQPLVGPRAL